jgi:hypothetical protein
MPSAAREKSTAGTLRLPPMMLDVINAQPRLAGNPQVFAVGVFNSFSQRQEKLDKKLPAMRPWVFPDLRRSAQSLMARAGVRPDTAERVLDARCPASRASATGTPTPTRRRTP